MRRWLVRLVVAAVAMPLMLVAVAGSAGAVSPTSDETIFSNTIGDTSCTWVADMIRTGNTVKLWLADSEERDPDGNNDDGTCYPDEVGFQIIYTDADGQSVSRSVYLAAVQIGNEDSGVHAIDVPARSGIDGRVTGHIGVDDGFTMLLEIEPRPK